MYQTKWPPIPPYTLTGLTILNAFQSQIWCPLSYTEFRGFKLSTMCSEWVRLKILHALLQSLWTAPRSWKLYRKRCPSEGKIWCLDYCLMLHFIYYINASRMVFQFHHRNLFSIRCIRNYLAISSVGTTRPNTMYFFLSIQNLKLNFCTWCNYCTLYIYIYIYIYIYYICTIRKHSMQPNPKIYTISRYHNILTYRRVNARKT